MEYRPKIRWIWLKETNIRHHQPAAQGMLVSWIRLKYTQHFIRSSTGKAFLQQSKKTLHTHFRNFHLIPLKGLATSPLSPISTSTSKEMEVLPIRTTFTLPAPIPPWPSGEGFATGSIDLGGLEVRQISTFTKVWATHEAGPDNLGATFFRPSPIPAGFFMLGCYCQPNNKPLFGWILVGKGDDNGDEAVAGVLRKPVDYTLVWSSETVRIKQDGYGYIWLPLPPQGYEAVGFIVTNSSEKPSLDEMRCIRSDLTDPCEKDMWIWGTRKVNNESVINVYGSRPKHRGTRAFGVCVGAFIAQVDGSASPLTLACLKNKDFGLSCMPNLSQIDALMQAYSPWIYFHPNERYLPSSVSWFFNNGALLYEQGGSKPSPIDPIGSNLPQGGSNDGSFWLDLPVDKGGKERVKRGDLESSECYLHVKPMLGAVFTDIAIWVFYPFNGPARAKVTFVDVKLGKIGQHVGDWEHVTLRISNFNGELWRVFLSQHGIGRWMYASELEFQGGNHVVTYASLHGHSFYAKPGLVLQGNRKLGIGIRNDCGRGKLSMDMGMRYILVAAEYLSSIIEPPWLDYTREWGPKISYKAASEICKAVRFLPGKLKPMVVDLINKLPKEVLGEEGPTGPKMKRSWNDDEV
ncbi:hypothetical protein At1g04090-like [Magnolia sinica]|uniref:hypothetical protein At1g04090-like n=1 Tax=Magnolia sinica TaxID=86752 RepID=UPI002657B39E|nr:hypothetical protein At1g04090-like [Magnolia sinica]